MQPSLTLTWHLPMKYEKWLTGVVFSLFHTDLTISRRHGWLWPSHKINFLWIPYSLKLRHIIPFGSGPQPPIVRMNILSIRSFFLNVRVPRTLNKEGLYVLANERTSLMIWLCKSWVWFLNVINSCFFFQILSVTLLFRSIENWSLFNYLFLSHFLVDVWFSLSGGFLVEIMFINHEIYYANDLLK